MSLTIVRLYHDLLGTYGDQGNAEVLIHRAKARNIDVDLIEVTPGMAVPRSGDIYLLGGGEDGPQVAALEMLKSDGGLNHATAGGATVLAICAGFQIIGESLPDSTGKATAGLGLVDTHTIYDSSPRSVGELVIQPSRGGLPVLTGFENHQGLTRLGDEMPPLGAVRSGVGNGFAKHEGVWHGNVFGSYMHGPALARNPELADAVLQCAVGPMREFVDPFANALAAERRHSLGGTAIND
jgi:lipid II isoglutaminyl synthase (glutamine-hydrolysing)